MVVLENNYLYVDGGRGNKINKSMENKTTTELLDLVTKLVDKEGRLKEGYNEAIEELKKREPFVSILKSDFETGESLEERLDELEETVKLLKRHKHDKNNDDVLIRL